MQSWDEILKLSRVNYEDIALTYIEYVLRKNGVLPMFLTNTILQDLNIPEN